MQSYSVFRLPPALLDTLTPRNLINQASTTTESVEDVTSSIPTNGVATSAGSKSCNVCHGVAFVDLEEQRSHYRSDWHRYNVKARLAGGNAVDEVEFSQLVNSLDDSISGSESSSDDSDESDSDAVTALVKKHKKRSSSPSDEARGPVKTALTWFHSPPSTQIGIYRALFTSEPPEYLAQLKEMQTSPAERVWTIFMVAGGHFAGAIVRFNRPEEEDTTSPQTNRKKPKRAQPALEVIKHKTFHRYTTRRKQGGSQSVNDNAKGNAKSAGAQIRRYGEMALRDDIRNLIADWKEDIDDSERIWIRANTSNRRIFMDYDECTITKKDERLRSFPFPTRRPTQAELTRCLNEVTKVKVSHLTEDMLRTQDEAYLASLPKPKVVVPQVTKPQPEKPKVPKLSKEEEALRDKWERLLDMIRKGRMEALKSFWEKQEESMGGVNVQIPRWTEERYDNLLQLASHCDQEEVVHWLLQDARADPTISVSVIDGEAVDTAKSDRRTAYDLTRERAVRDVFRRAAGDHPDWWDWFGAARIPSALSKEMEDEREEKKKVRRKGLKDRLKEREKTPKVTPTPSAAPSPSPPKTLSGPQKLGGASGAADAVMGLTPEMRAKIERERRARAAEARLGK